MLVAKDKPPSQRTLCALERPLGIIGIDSHSPLIDAFLLGYPVYGRPAVPFSKGLNFFLCESTTLAHWALLFRLKKSVWSSPIRNSVNPGVLFYLVGALQVEVFEAKSKRIGETRRTAAAWYLLN